MENASIWSTTAAEAAARPASELAAGDVIVTSNRHMALVVSEPDLVHRGLSPFDEFELLAGIEVESLTDKGETSGRKSYLILRPDAQVPVLDASGSCTGGTSRK
jgi:hypothetical protein